MTLQQIGGIWVAHPLKKVTFLSGGYLPSSDEIGVILESETEEGKSSYTVSVESLDDVEPTIQSLLEMIPTCSAVVWGG